MRLSFRLFVRSLAGAVLAAVVMLSIGAGQASAQQSQTLTASQFLANPNQLLQQFPDGGSQMMALVQQFAVEDGSTVPVIIGLLGAANPRQKGAIGEALAQAAKIIVLTDQARAADLESRIVAINDPVVNIAFANGLGDVKLGGVGAGPGGLGAPGAGLGGPGVGPGGGGGLQPIGNLGVNTPTFSITSSVGGAGGTSPSTTTLSNQVSSTTLP
jgi:hypothetical protein